jgi:hypothetical protein
MPRSVASKKMTAKKNASETGAENERLPASSPGCSRCGVTMPID